MKRLPLFFALALMLAMTACQKETTNGLDAILENETLQEEIQELAEATKIGMEDVVADRRSDNCSGLLFADVLAEFVANNQQNANESCQTIRGGVSGCYEGFMTYGTALVFPQPGTCNQVEKKEPNGKQLTDKHTVSPKANFKASLTTSDCFAGGKSVQAKIAEGEHGNYRYAYLWKLDGKTIGIMPQAECLKGNMLSLTITQYPSKDQITKYLRLDNADEE